VQSTVFQGTPVDRFRPLCRAHTAWGRGQRDKWFRISKFAEVVTGPQVASGKAGRHLLPIPPERHARFSTLAPGTLEALRTLEAGLSLAFWDRSSIHMASARPLTRFSRRIRSTALWPQSSGDALWSLACAWRGMIAEELKTDAL
jgi:hypothetical protein